MKAYIVKENTTGENKGAFYNAKAVSKWMEENNLTPEDYTVEALPLQK